MAVTRIASISLTSADANHLAAFYQDAFGFEPVGLRDYTGADFAHVVGIEGARARALLLRLGTETIELLTFSQDGEPYPANSTSDDLRFQHFAIVVSDMQSAYARLLRCDGWTPITRPGPQQLPPSSGGVTAFKFRDPEGHPLELLAFPPESGPARWRKRRSQETQCLGIDHSAIVVASTQLSIEFYGQLLGLSAGPCSLNRGEEQERLDGVPEALVEVTALYSKLADSPHLELLCYRSVGHTGTAAPALHPNDIAATRIVLEVEELAPLASKLARASATFISAGIVALPDEGGSAMVRDPDGHAVLLRERGDGP